VEPEAREKRLRGIVVLEGDGEALPLGDRRACDDARWIDVAREPRQPLGVDRDALAAPRARDAVGEIDERAHVRELVRMAAPLALREAARVELRPRPDARVLECSLDVRVRVGVRRSEAR